MNNISVLIDTEEVSKNTDVALLCRQADIQVANQHDYDLAADVLANVKKRYKELDAERKEITKPIDDAKKRVMELFNAPLSLLKKAEDALKRLMIDYTNEQERKAREEQLRLQRIAEKAAEEEKKKLEAKIARAEASGKEEKAENLKEELESVEPISVPVIAPQVEKPKGISYKDKWSAIVVDFSKLPDEYKLPNQSALDKVAQATKGSIAIPGVKFESEKILSSRS
jgi:hypothetical protein